MTEERVQVVVLDLGNVLVFHDNLLLVNRLAERAGTDVVPISNALAGPLSEAINRGVYDAEGIRREVCAILGVDIPMSEFAELWSSHFTPYEDMVSRVAALAQKVRLVLLSNTNALHWDFLRPRLPALQYFDRCLVSHELGLVKPEPAIYEKALEAGGAPAERTAFFDDIPAYVEAASSLGIHGRVFTTAEAFDAQLRDLL